MNEAQAAFPDRSEVMMSMNAVRLITSILMLMLSGCAATMVNTFQEDLTDPYGFAGGTFSYLDQGADFVIAQRVADGMVQAKHVCGGREIHIVGENRKATSGVMSMPVTQTAQHQGTVSNGYNSSAYSGSTTYTTYQSVPYTTVRNRVTFICMDDDRQDSLFRIASPKDAAPVCENVPDYETAGHGRLEQIALAASSDDCRSDGWIRHLTKDSKKAHLFIGDVGKQKCKQIENQLIDQQVASSDVNLWLRKNLTCSIKKGSQ